NRLHNRCACGGTLLARYDFDGVTLDSLRARPEGLWRYRELLPVAGEPVSLGEPQTALIGLERLSQRWGVEAYLKDDQTLAGGTFKARGAAVGLSRAVELGVKRIVMPSAGNAGGAWALYGARAGLEVTVTMARSAPLANQTEVRMAGAELVLVDGTIADAATAARDIAARDDAYLTATFSEPYRLEGKKSCFLELFDQLGDASSMRFPRTIVLPVGGGVAAIAARKASREIASLGWGRGELPRIVGVQARNCAPITRAFERGEEQVSAWEGDPMTIAAGLRVPAPSEGALVLERVRGSGGRMLAIGEEDIVAAVHDLAATEGVFACPEGAAAVAGAEALAAAGELEGPVVVYNTGAGTKYVDAFTEDAFTREDR
ncbi:MAG: threonine synthase, partial [Actinomycetota bacterium]